MGIERLSHWSKEQCVVPEAREQRWHYGVPSEYEKPKGLWVSVDGEHDWEECCTAESFDDLPSKYRHTVYLTDQAHILRCVSAFDLDLLTERYGFEIPGYSFRRVAIEWDRIARSYQGIIIAPYCWQRRLHDAYSWYYSWDCASGCIWDPAAIASVELTMAAA